MSESATNVLVSRSQFLAFMKVGATPAYELIGEGFTSFSESKNPKEYTRQYVHETGERTDVIGYSPSIAYAVDVYSNDPVISEIVDITDNEYLGALTHRKICSVNLWRPGTTSGTYEAYERTYAVIPDSKGDGAEALNYSGTLKCVGDKVKGTFALATKVFTADA